MDAHLCGGMTHSGLKMNHLRGHKNHIIIFLLAFVVFMWMGTFSSNLNLAFLNNGSSVTFTESALLSSSPSVAPLLPRMNATELGEHLAKESTRSHEKEIPVPLLFPKPKLSRTVQLYNPDAWKDLRQRLASQNKFSCLANGGSPTAGACLLSRYDIFPYTLQKYLQGMATTTTDVNRSISLPQALFSPHSNFQVLPRGHGARNTLDSALLMDLYVPEDDLPDLIVWEFAINDLRGAGKDASRNQLIFWLDQVARRVERSQTNQKPPLVILAYLWQGPFRMNETIGQLKNSVFEWHENLPETYPFVIGHVNAGSYLDELHAQDKLTWESRQLRKRFLSDEIHPNYLGHMLMAYLLYDLIQDASRLSGTDAAASPPFHLRPTETTVKFNLASLGNKTVAKTPGNKNLLLSLINPVPDESPNIVAAYAPIEPMNEYPTAHMLYSTNKNLSDYERQVGKASPSRWDRKKPFNRLAVVSTMKLLTLLVVKEDLSVNFKSCCWVWG